MSKRTVVQLFWKLRPYYRIAIVDQAAGLGQVRWDPAGRTGGRKLRFKEFTRLVALHRRSASGRGAVV